MTQDGLRIAGTLGGGGRGAQPPSHTVQTGLPRERAKSLTRATQPGLMMMMMSPGASDQAPTVPSSEPLIRVRGKSSPCRLLLCQADRRRSVVMRGPCAGAARDPPIWIVPNKALSLSLSLSLSQMLAGLAAGRGGATGILCVCLFITAGPIIRLCWGGWGSGGHVL
jgi:hypothetical protein